MAADVFRDRWTKPESASLADLLGRLTAGLPGDGWARIRRVEIWQVRGLGEAI